MGSRKGPSARILFGNSGRHESRSGGILGPATQAKREKGRFFAREKVRKKVSRPLCCDDGGPLGRPFSLLRAYGGLTGTRLGTVLGSRRGRPSIANTKHDDFWCFLGVFPRRSPPAVGGSFLETLIRPCWTIRGPPKRASGADTIRECGAPRIALGRRFGAKY